MHFVFEERFSKINVLEFITICRKLRIENLLKTKDVQVLCFAPFKSKL